MGGAALQYAQEHFRQDREVVMAAVGQDPLKALCHASDALRADREVVLLGVRKHGLSLRHASADLRADREVVVAAVRQSSRALVYAAERFQDDNEVRRLVLAHGEGCELNENADDEYDGAALEPDDAAEVTTE